MKRIFLAVVAVVGAAYTCGAAADHCTDLGGYQLVSGVTTKLNGKQVNAVTAVGNVDEWKEKTCTGGVLFNVGDGTNVDPSVQIGTWSEPANNQVQYNYTGGGHWRWTLYEKIADVDKLCWALDSANSTSSTITAVTGNILNTTCP